MIKPFNIISTKLRLWQFRNNTIYCFSKTIALIELAFFRVLSWIFINHFFFHKYLDKLENYRRFYTTEGRLAFVQAMVTPIRRTLDYQAVGRRLLMVDELPQGAYARYQRDVTNHVSAATEYSVANNTLATPIHLQEDIGRLQQQMQLLGYDNSTFATGRDFSNRSTEDIAVYAPYIPLYVSDYRFDIHNMILEEDALYTYLFWKNDLKEENIMSARRENIRNSINQLELGD